VSTSRTTDATPGTLSRWANRPGAGPLMKVAMVLFTIGVIAIVVDLAMFASGARDLPLWLNLLCLLAPVGLGLGLLGTYFQARSWRKNSAAS